MDNVQFLNAIRSASSEDYQNRIPEATRNNLKDIQTTVMTYAINKNEFIDTLLNKVVKTMITSKYYENPFKFFKKGSIPFGRTLENVFVDIIKAKSFEEKFGDGSEAGSLLGKEVANVKAEYYSENYRHKYKVSISDERLKSAFFTENGLQDLTNAIVNSALTSAENDEYLLIKSLICGGQFTEVEIANFDTLTEEEQAKKITKLAKTYINKFRFLSKNYNKQQVSTYSLASDCVILVTPETKAMIDVDLLSTAFHLDKAEMEGRLVMIDEFTKLGIDGKTMEADDDTLCIVCDKDLVQFYDTLNHSEPFRNPDSLTTNIFFHRWGSVSLCGFANAIKIKKQAV